METNNPLLSPATCPHTQKKAMAIVFVSLSPIMRLFKGTRQQKLARLQQDGIWARQVTSCSECPFSMWLQNTMVPFRWYLPLSAAQVLPGFRASIAWCCFLRRPTLLIFVQMTTEDNMSAFYLVTEMTHWRSFSVKAPLVFSSSFIVIAVVISRNVPPKIWNPTILREERMGKYTLSFWQTTTNQFPKFFAIFNFNLYISSIQRIGTKYH